MKRLLFRALLPGLVTLIFGLAPWAIHHVLQGVHDHFYNVQGLHPHKDKFDPVWRPTYLACPGGLAVPRVLTAVNLLVSRGVRGVVTK